MADEVDTSGRYAIVGIGCRLPGGVNCHETFWSLLAEGRDAVAPVPDDRPDWARLYDPDPAASGRIYTRLGGFVDGIDLFDARFFGISPREATRIDPQQRLLLEVVWHAFEDARIPLDTLAGSETGVFIGVSTHDYADMQMYPQNRHAIDAHSNTGGATAIVANRISFAFDLKGPSLAVDTACSSALTAVHLACRALEAGDCTLAIAGGVQVLLRPELTIGFCRATMLSVDGHCKAFDASGNGYVRSEGAGAVILKPLARALADGDRIHAVILGSAINQDGRSSGLTVPSETSQRAMLASALRRAGLRPDAVQYVEAHGTGTAVGDPIEARAIGSVFGEGRRDTDPLLIGSVKTNIGHLEAAAGMPGLIKTALSLSHRRIPASLHFRSWNPAIDHAALKLRVVTELEPWPASTEPPAAAVSSFGFGGANASVILGPAPDATLPPAQAVREQAEILTLAARSPEALQALAASHSRLLAEGRVPIAAVCGAAALGRSHGEYRVSIVGDSSDALADALDSFVSGDTIATFASGRASVRATDKLAFVFSGMGPQWWAMGRQLLGRDPVFTATMERCDVALRPHSGWSLMDEFLADEATSRVAHPQLAQVTNFALQVSLLDLWQSWGITPGAVIGHSGGAMAAAYAAGIHSLEDAIWLCYHRSRLQGRDSNAGEMLAVGLPASEADELIRGHEAQVSLAAVNSPTSMTLAGDGEVLRRIAARLTERQVFARMLAVTIAYHSPKMDPIRDEFLQAVSGLTARPARLPFVSDTTGTWNDGAECDAAYWWRAIRSPVRFADSIGTLLDAGFTSFVEVSPHPVLAAAMAECIAARGLKGLVVPSLRRNEHERVTMLRSLGTLYVNGAMPDFSALYRRDFDAPLPLYPFQRDRHWFDPQENDAEGAGLEPMGEADPNGLLGRRLPSAQPVWEAHLGLGKLDYLDDHVIQGTPIFPGAGYVAMGLAAALRIAPNGPTCLRHMEFLRPLVLSSRSEVRAQIAVDPVTLKVQIHAGSAADRATWMRYSGARLSRGIGMEPERIDLARLQERLGGRSDPTAFYDRLRRRGLAYGPRFLGIAEIWRDGREALGRIGPLSELPRDPDSVHPALLDAAFQLLAVIADCDPAMDDRLFLPVQIEEIRLHAPAGDAFWAYCRLDSQTDAQVVGSLQIVADDGSAVLSVRGLQAQLVDRAAGAPAALDQWLYTYDWVRKPLAPSPSPPRRPAMIGANLGAVDREAAALVRRVEAETGWPRYYSEAEPVLSRLAAAEVLSAFAELDLPSAPGGVLGETELTRLRAGDPSGGLWTERLIGLLAETGFISPNGSGWTIADGATSRTEPVPLPGYETDVALLREAGRTLASALSGGAAGRDAVVTAATLPLLRAFYRDAPASAFYNSVLTGAVAALLPDRAGAGHLRVLEVGGGTGGATLALLGVLPAERTRYLFTDVAATLVEQARADFADMPSVETCVFDLSRDPAGQGLEPASFDLIVAANVVHATADVAASLRALRSLLLPGGVLALIEITRHPRWLDVIFGQTRGWWLFEDRDLRSEHPLLESAQWTQQLSLAGFADVWTSCEPASPGEAAQTVLLASAPRPGAAGPPWLLVSDGGEICERLSRRLERSGRTVVLAAADEFAKTLDALDQSPAGILHLGPERRDEQTLPGHRADSLYSATSVLRTILGRPALRTCPVWLVTSGATRLEGDQGDDVFQAAVLGLGRTLLKEHPDVALRLIDIGCAPDDTTLDRLLDEVSEHDPDEEVALRGADRFVRRLQRRAPDDFPAREAVQRSGENHWRAVVGTRGSLGSLHTRPFRPLAPGPLDVQIAIKAASLNFRDVMLAVGGIPGLEGELSFGHQHLGSDCAGVVTAVGSAVTGFRVGDAVLGMAPGTLASVSTTPARLMAHKPPGLSFEEAASIPTVFLTAWYALRRVGQLQPGETILIHAATGGVGLAAIQIARDIGAEILATAGSDAKREHLRALGVRHVFDSRSLAFAEQVREATGGVGVDMVLNSLSGEAIERGVACLKPYGRFLELGKLDIYTNRDLPLSRFRQNLTYAAIDLDRMCAEKPELVGAMLGEVVAEFGRGRLRPVPRHHFGMTQFEDAFRLMAQARHIGKVVLSHDVDQPGAWEAATSVSELRGDGSYLVTGGLGGFGLEVASHLATRGAGAIVLLGRSPPRDTVRHRIAALREAGHRIEVVAGDIADEVALDTTLQRFGQDLPPLRGVFHAAMVLDDRPLEDMSRDSLDRVMRPKALGAWMLHCKTAGLALDHFVMFSSITSLLGNPLQANYAAAGTFLDALAHHRRARNLPALTVNWGVLTGAGYVAERQDLQNFLEQQGYGLFAPADALAVLDAMLGRDVPQVMAARIDWQRLASFSPRAAASPRVRDLIPAEAAAFQGGAASEIMRSLAAAPPTERTDLLERFIAQSIGRVLGVPATHIEPERPFNELGLDSLLAVEFMHVLTRDLGFETPVLALLDGMTSRRLAATVVAELASRPQGLAAARAASPGLPKGDDEPVPVPPAASQPAAMAPPSSARPVQIVRPAAPSSHGPDYSSLDYAKWSPMQSALRMAAKIGFSALGRVDVDGVENLPVGQPFILAVNHLSMADVPLALTVMPRRTIILANQRLQRSPVLDMFVGWLGQAIYVSKGGDAGPALEHALAVLRSGGIVALAPEGTRNRSGLGRPQTGIGWLAQKSGLPVVPYAAWGQERWRERVRQPARISIGIRFGTPIPPPAAEADLRVYADDVMLALARMLPPEYRGLYGEKVEAA